MFVYFIVAPKKDEEMRNAFATKIADAGRKAPPRAPTHLRKIFT
jgi:hypothetical protein